MKFAKTEEPETDKNVHDRSTVIYNDYVTVKNIPLKAYYYVVNGKRVIEWVIELQALSDDADSGIVNDDNLWATETMKNAAYPLELPCASSQSASKRLTSSTTFRVLRLTSE